jgi:hypothetical protein
MKTFFNILQTIVSINEKSFPDEPFKLLNNISSSIEAFHIKFIINQIFYIVKKKNNDDCQYKKNASAKFEVLNKLLDNLFILEDLKESLFNIFSKAQKHYYAFLRLAHLYKFKRNNILVDSNLSLNPLDILNNNTFILIEHRSKYLFSIHDLISIIETAISNSPMFFSDPLWPLNPYNKQPFTITNLYNIYFKMKNSGIVMSTLFHLFFLENFDISSFMQNNEPYIRNHSIKKYVYNTTYSDLYFAVLNMLNSNIYTIRLNIHKNFPKDLLVKIFRPFLYYYYIINYDIKGTNKIQQYKIILNKKLKKFYEYNKAFGRKYIKLITNSKKRVLNHEYHFNTNHIAFNDINISDGLAIVGTAVQFNTPLQYATHLMDFDSEENNNELDDELDNEITYENQLEDYNNNDNNNEDGDSDSSD